MCVYAFDLFIYAYNGYDEFAAFKNNPPPEKLGWKKKSYALKKK